MGFGKTLKEIVATPTRTAEDADAALELISNVRRGLSEEETAALIATVRDYLSGKQTLTT
jgi:hypothetical protein